jgi:hypothetical protein
MMSASSADQTTVTAAMTAGLSELCIRHPSGTFALTPASLISLQTIGQHRKQLSGTGLDWGSGTGCLAIAAAKIPEVEKVIGLEISEDNLVIARENAVRNGVEAKVTFTLSDSYAPRDPHDKAMLQDLAGKVSFILANPPSSEGDDGFGYRRVVLRGARAYLRPEGVVFLSISYQYGRERILQLGRESGDFEYAGLLSSTDWVPFDLNRPDLLHCLHLYAEEERRGGLEYRFGQPEASPDGSLNARAALLHYQKTGQSPWSKWQTHLFVFRPGKPKREPGSSLLCL